MAEVTAIRIHLDIMCNKVPIEVHNPLYKEDTKASIKLCRLFALIIGLWPTYFENSMFQRILKFIIQSTYYSITLFTYISSILYIIFVLNELHPRLLIVGPLTFWSMLMAKYSIFLYRSKDIKKLIKIIEEDWQIVETSEHRGLMMKNMKFARSVTIICASFMFGGGLSYHLLIPLTADSIVTEMNITVQPFPSPAYGSFFTNGLSPIYELVFIVKVLTGVMNDTINVTTFSLFAVLILHTCGQLDVIMLHLNNLVSTTKESQDVFHDRLVMIIKHHLRVLR